MPIRVGANIEIKGLERVLARLNQLQRESAERAAAEIAMRFPIAQLRGEVPKRTGRLRRSLRVVQRGNRITLEGVWYGRVVRWSGGRSVNREFYRLARQALERMGAIRL